MRDDSQRIARVTPQAGWHGREEQTNGGVRRTGALFRWMIAPRPGDMGEGRSECKEREKRRRRVKNGREIGDRSGGRGKQRSITRLEQVGNEHRIRVEH